MLRQQHHRPRKVALAAAELEGVGNQQAARFGRPNLVGPAPRGHLFSRLRPTPSCGTRLLLHQLRPKYAPVRVGTIGSQSPGAWPAPTGAGAGRRPQQRGWRETWDREPMSLRPGALQNPRAGCTAVPTTAAISISKDTRSGCLIPPPPGVRCRVPGRQVVATSSRANS